MLPDTPGPYDSVPTPPTALAALLFLAKASVHQARRGAQNALAGGARRLPRAEALASRPVLAESRSALWSESDAAEARLQMGKVHNLRTAVGRIAGVEVPAGALFSFWAQLGRPTRWRGYVEGRELREGCVIASVAGGLCQLSNALYDAALGAGLEIVERHAHSRVIPGSLAERGRDATVFWNYVDLRMRSAVAFRLEAELTASELVVRIRGTRAPHPAAPAAKAPRVALQTGAAPQSCATCGVASCFRESSGAARRASVGRAAFLVDEHWPEHDEWIASARCDRDLLLLPLDGARFGKAAYAWRTDGFADVSESRLFTAMRSIGSRRLAAQGATRQRAQLAFDERLARRYAARLSPDVVHVVVAQSLLPFLWRTGALGGRTFDVLMTRLPLEALHDRLDLAAARHPRSPTLADFRAPPAVVRAESEALAAARRIVTPHAEVAGLFGPRAERLAWRLPAPRAEGRAPAAGREVLFAATTLGRKGCYELRDAARALDVGVVTMGPVLEGADFWQGVRTRAAAGDRWLDGVAAVVLPAYVEHRPRRLLAAMAAGARVIASGACGLDAAAGVTVIPTGDGEALREAIGAVLADAVRPGSGCPGGPSCATSAARAAVERSARR